MRRAKPPDGGAKNPSKHTPHTQEQRLQWTQHNTPKEADMTSTTQATMRGIRRAMAVHAGDLSGIRKMRKQIEATDYVTEAWNDVGRAMYEAMNQTPTPQTTSSPSSHTPSTGK